MIAQAHWMSLPASEREVCSSEIRQNRSVEPVPEKQVCN